MAKFIGFVVGAIEVGVGIATGNVGLIVAGGLTIAAAGATLLLTPTIRKQASATTVQTGEITRRGIFGTGATGGSLVDAFNYGGKYGTGWTVLVIAIADHLCAGLVGFYVNSTYVTFSGDGFVPDVSDDIKFRGQLQVYWRPGSWDQDVPAILTDNCPVVDGQPTWTANDRGRGVSYVVVAYEADKSDAKHPVWSDGLPQFLWVVKGALCYSGRADSSIGGAGAQRWEDPTTRQWSENVIDCRYTWARGFYAGDKIDQPEMLLLGRGLTDVEAPPENTFAPANVCDEQVARKGILSSLANAASKGDHTITLSTVAGLADGMTLTITQDGGFNETATVQSIAGDAVTLTSGLDYDHPVLTVVSWATSSSAASSEARYTIGGVFGGDDAYIDTENAFMAACGGWIVEREGSVELVPGSAQPVVWSVTDDDLIVGSSVSSSDFRSITDDAWCNSVVAQYVEPTQKWAGHSAPIRRIVSDVEADGTTRIVQPNLTLCTSGTQAQRVAEQMRRMGRLVRQRSITLGPRFIGAEHGDWLQWTSSRYGPRPAQPDGTLVPLLLRIESDAQDEKWQNSLSFREVAANVFDWNAQVDELADGAVAVQAATPNFGDQPGENSWALTAVLDTGDGSQAPALVFVGACDDDLADAIIFEYASGSAEPDADNDSLWTAGGNAPVSATRVEITGVLAGTDYWGAVSYQVAGALGERLVLGPVTTAAADGSAGRLEREDGGRELREDGSQQLRE